MAAVTSVPGSYARAATLRRMHLVIGLAGVLAFLGTGAFMAMGFPALYAADETIRFTLRANHVYLLFASLANLLMAAYLAINTDGWRRRAAVTGAALIVVAPFVLWAAFLLEGPTGAPERPLTFFGVAFVLVGIAFQLLNRPRSALP